MTDRSPQISRPLRLHLRFRTDGTAAGGGGGANLIAAAALGRVFERCDAPDEADLQVCSLDWRAPDRPPRVFLDHGSFADASFWAYTVPSLRSGDTIVVTSRVCMQVADRLLRPGSVQVLEVPLPIDADRFRPALDRAALRKALQVEHGLPPAGPLLLVVAAFVRRKNHHLAIELLAALRRAVPGARMVFVGAVPDRDESRRYRERVESLAAANGMGEAVHFLGAQPADAVARLMAGADALVHLSTCRLENFGLVVAEAAACGLPVLAADWGGLRDIVRPGETGLLAPTWLSNRGPRVDWSALVEPAARLLGDPPSWRAMSSAARARACRSYDVGTQAARLCDAVRSAADWSRRAAAPVARTEAGEDLAFRTMTLNAVNPGIRDAGDEFRLLVPLEEGRYYRMLIGPAATREHVRPLRMSDAPRPIVRWQERGGVIDVIDPVWPSSLSLDEAALGLLRRCDGTRSLQAMLAESAPAEAARLLAITQSLVDEGVLAADGMTDA